jgi:hypothetical protein
VYYFFSTRDVLPQSPCKEYRVRSRSTGIAVCLLSLLAAGTARAQTVTVYDSFNNFSTLTGQSILNGGAVNQSGNNITTLLADDLSYNPAFAGSSVTTVTVTVAHLNSVNVPARARIRFYDSNGAGGGPGTLLASAEVTLNWAANSFNAFNLGFAPGAFVLPASGTIWAGQVFDNSNGTTTATTAQLNNFGQAVTSAITIGSSADIIFRSSAAGSFNASNPAGTLANLGGNPVANTAWRLQVATSAPEPGTLAFLGLWSLPLATRLIRRRR